MPKSSRRGKPRQGRNRRNFVAIPFHVTVALLNAPDGDLVEADIVTFGEDIFVISVDGTWSVHDITAGEGPLQCGYHHGDLATTEVQENLIAELTDPDDIIQRERARRPVRQAGTFSIVAGHETLNNGVPIRTPVKFYVGDGHALSIHVKNISGAQLTTGATVVCNGLIYGRWER